MSSRTHESADPVEIILGRHGQDVDGFNGILNGHRNTPLTELGRAQADEVAVSVRKIGGIVRIVSSPLERAVQTAIPAAECLGIEVEVAEELIERDLGDVTGLSVADALRLIDPADIIETFHTKYVDDGYGFESFEKATTRAGRAYERIQETTRVTDIGSRALVMCHGDIGMAMCAYVSGIPMRELIHEMKINNGDLIHLRRGEAPQALTLTDEYQTVLAV